MDEIVFDAIKNVYVAQRKAAAFADGTEAMREFFRDWENAGIFDHNLDNVSDEVVEVTKRYCILAMRDATDEQVQAAKTWLILNGYKFPDEL